MTRRFVSGWLAGFLWATRVATAAEPIETQQVRGAVRAEIRRPEHFPHRIWAACDFEGQTPDYGWFGRPDTNQIPAYPGNFTALSAERGPYQKVSAIMAGMNPV